MEHLRLIILLLGLALVAGIYIWDRLRRRALAQARDALEPSSETPAPTTPSQGDLDSFDGTWPEHGAKDVVLGDLESIVPDRDSTTDAAAAASAPEAPVAPPSEPRQVAAARPPEKQSPATEKEMLVAVTVMAKPGQSFSGTRLVEALESVQMRHGDMQIFHHFGPSTRRANRPVFSVASVLKPGTFDLDRLDNFSTTGLSLFMQLPGDMDGRAAISLFLHTGQKLADILGGKLCDERREPLTQEALDRLKWRAAAFPRLQDLVTE